jgi:hypothetical protein
MPLLSYEGTATPESVFFFSKGSYFYDQPNLLLLVIEPGLFLNCNICGRFWGKIGNFGRNWPERRTLTWIKSYFIFYLIGKIPSPNGEEPLPLVPLDALTSVIFCGGICTKIERCSYYQTFEFKWSSYLLVLAAPKKSLTSSYEGKATPESDFILFHFIVSLECIDIITQ